MMQMKSLFLNIGHINPIDETDYPPLAIDGSPAPIYNYMYIFWKENASSQTTEHMAEIQWKE